MCGLRICPVCSESIACDDRGVCPEVVCPIYEVAQQSDRPYIAMGFIEGESLGEWAKKRRPSARESAEVIAKVARAVGFAHEHQVIHRDVKPANVMGHRYMKLGRTEDATTFFRNALAAAPADSTGRARAQ